MVQSVAIVFLGFGGFLLALYLFHKKRRKTEHFICPLRGNCTDVINSDYSRFLGVPVEVLGMIYYAAIALGHGLLMAFPVALVWLDVPLLLASTLALFFSLYLTFIQLVSLRKICTWCLLSATFCLFIFLLSLSITLEAVLPVLEAYHPFVLILHVVSMALGLGAATLSDVFFFRFLKDGRISEFESSVLSTLSEFIWLALGFILLTGFALFVPHAGELLALPKFLAKMAVVGVIMINGAMLNLYIAPKLVKISFGEQHHHKQGELMRARRLAFALGSVSIISWYSAFVLGMLPGDIAYTLFDFLKLYALLLVAGVAIGQFVENRIAKRSVPWPTD